MGKFLRNILIGVGIGLLFAPMPGQDMRRIVSERVRGFIGSLPSNADNSNSSGAGTVSASRSGINTSTAARTEHAMSGARSAASAPSSSSSTNTEQGLRNIAESAMRDQQASNSLVSQPFEPAYPEYVNPERNTPPAATPSSTPATPPKPKTGPAPAPDPRSSTGRPNQNPKPRPK
jgi:hypothetical protein